MLLRGGNSMSDLIIEGGAARSDEAMLETTVSAKQIDTDLAAASAIMMRKSSTMRREFARCDGEDAQPIASRTRWCGSVRQ